MDYPKKGMRRFERIHDVVEPVEEYRVGGYHPVHLDDTFHQRYQVVGKWAFGQFSTVWLAKDTRHQRYVTLKILKADASEGSQELSVLIHLSKTRIDCPGRDNVLQLLDHFEHRGPNGLHLCLVFPVMMSDGQEMTVRERPRHPKYVREVSKQILRGLNYLHDQGLIHGDLQPANILFTVSPDSPSEILTKPELSYVKWLPGVEVDNSAPRYLIGDLGGAIWSLQDNACPVTPAALRAPELLLHRPWNQKVDIWALGCLIFQLATNETLFPAGCFGYSKAEMDDNLLSLMHDFFNGGLPGFIVRIREKVPPEFGQKESESLAGFLWEMLQERAEDRKSTTELLNHSFIL
ncbi:hypothetical protein N7470_009702 [Penicillium chermesinum]|nr:hypothetical protein N7470_009702 [Penicillium chermesinum]